MKSIIKFGDMKPETIAKGIMICIAVLIICRNPIFSFIIPPDTPIMNNAITFYLVTIGALIIVLILLRLICEVIYNIVAAAQCIIGKEASNKELQLLVYSQKDK